MLSINGSSLYNNYLCPQCYVNVPNCLKAVSSYIKRENTQINISKFYLNAS